MFLIKFCDFLKKGYIRKMLNSISNRYNDIINLPHPTSKKHPQMKLEVRAAQFAPFSALTGYDEQVKNTAKIINELK